MLTKSKRKLIRSLATRKGRDETGLFLAEGPKLVCELCPHFHTREIIVSDSWAHDNEAYLQSLFGSHDVMCDIVSDSDFQSASLQPSPQGVIALFDIPEYDAEMCATHIPDSLHLALDDVQDPGNLGTIVRLAAWFGVSDIWCSLATADVWAPKAVQATMGGLSRVRVHYINLYDMIRRLPPHTPRYATMLDGLPIWKVPLSPNGLLVMGNEGRGISREVAGLCDRRLLVPTYPQDAVTTDSLNVGMATAIVLAEFRRRMYK